MSRASHYSAKARHAQREFGVAKQKLQPVGSDTTWVPEFISSAEGIGSFNSDSIICLPLGADKAERELNLRKASAMGVLHMSVVRGEQGQFVEYRWTLV